MKRVRLILANIMGGSFGSAIGSLFAGHINFGLGMLAIGLFIGILYLSSLIADI